MEFNNSKKLNVLILIMSAITVCILQKTFAVTSKITSHISSDDFLKGEADNIIIGSKGTLQLSHTNQVISEDFKDTWAINSIVLSGGKIYLGTSPNGGIYQYSLGKLTEIYKATVVQEKEDEVKEEDDPNNNKDDEKEEHLTNEHIFAMATDISGRLLAGISGKRCTLVRLDSGKFNTIYEPDDAKYIFAIFIADNGTIYLGTGPEGKIYSLDSSGKNPKVVLDSTDKNILSLAMAADGSLLAGSDTRGLVYSINIDTGKAKVLYDSEQEEVTALLVDDSGDIFAAATSAKVIKEQNKFASTLPAPGRPEKKSEGNEKPESGSSSLNLKVANTKESDSKSTKKASPARSRPAKPSELSFIYKISPEGFVTDVFSRPAVLFTLNEHGDELILGTGNNAELYTISPQKERSAVIFKDKKASQITSVAVLDDEIYLGTANPPRLIKLNKSFANEGTFLSDLIDASQPAEWGKLQIDAEIPKDCKVQVSSRSGNVKDVNDPTFSQWSDAVEIKAPVQVVCPIGRFFQYKLILNSLEDKSTPVIREVAVANTIPNLAPVVKGVTVEKIKKPGKSGIFEIKYQADDKNSDTLVYKIDFRKINRDRWIELEDQTDKTSYEWDSKTVEDGRYEFRITANDEKSNSTQQAMTGTRVSDIVVVDNTGPIIDILSIGDEKDITLLAPAKLNTNKAVIEISVIDKYSVINSLEYTVNSSEDYKAAIPDDLVFDTTKENFKITIDDLKQGEHIIALRAKDDVGNTTYTSIEIEVE